MANGIEDALRDRAEGVMDSGVGSPIITVVAAVEEDMSRAESDRVADTLKEDVMEASPVVRDVVSNHVIGSFGARTSATLRFGEVRDIRSQLRNSMSDQGYTVKDVAVMAEGESSPM